MTLIKKADPFEYDRADSDAWLDFMNAIHIDVTDPAYGALGNGTGNDAPAIQAAINAVPARGGIVYLPPGTYLLTSAIVFPTDRQCRLIGAGPEATILSVPSGTTATPGVIHVRGTEFRSSVENLQIAFAQPDTADRNVIIHYVPAIFAQSIARFRVQHVRIVRAWFGIDMRLNATAEINDLEISHFDTGIWIDGSLDSIRIAHVHDWVFGTTGNMQTAMANELNVGIRIGRSDGTHISDSLFLCGTGIHTYYGTALPGFPGPPILHITNCQFDTWSGLLAHAGYIRVSNSVFSTVVGSGYQGISAIPVNVGGAANMSLLVDNCAFIAVGAPGPTIEVRGIAGGGYLLMNICNSVFYQGNAESYAIIADATSGGVIHLNIDGNHFDRASNVAYTSPTIAIGANVRATVCHNTTLDKGAGAGKFLETLTTAAVVVYQNILPGWALNYAGTIQPVSGNNSGAALIGAQRELNATMGYVQASGINILDPAINPPFAVKRLTGTLDGAGAATPLHGITNHHLAGLIAQAWQRGGGGLMAPLTIAAIDGSNVFLSGGTAGVAYRVTLLYSSNLHAW